MIEYVSSLTRDAILKALREEESKSEVATMTQTLQKYRKQFHYLSSGLLDIEPFKEMNWYKHLQKEQYQLPPF